MILLESMRLRRRPHCRTRSFRYFAVSPLFVVSTAVLLLFGGMGVSVASSSQTSLPLPSYEEAAISTDWVLTPMGYAYADCVYTVPDGAEVSVEDRAILTNGVRYATIPECPYAGVVNMQNNSMAVRGSTGQSSLLQGSYPNDWWLDTWWDSPLDIMSLSAQWVVPAAPATTGALIYLFTSLQPSGAGGGILQPVLQWGSNGAFGGNFWGMANWSLFGGNMYHGNMMATPTGHSIKGTISRTSVTTKSWIVSFTDITTGQSSDYSTTTNTSSWKAVQGGVLEVNNATSCKQLPKTTGISFTSITVKNGNGTVTPSFVEHNHLGTCASSITRTTTSAVLQWSAS